MVRVLFVDDDPSGQQTVLRLMLKKTNDWVMSFADSAHAAFDKLETDSFDVVVTGTLRGSVSGVQLLELVELRWPVVARVLLARGIPAPEEMGPVHAFLLLPVEDELLCVVVDGLASAPPEARRSAWSPAPPSPR